MKDGRKLGYGVLVLIWVVLTALCWFGPAKELSESERRPLAQRPEITLDRVLEGKFMGEFEAYSLDQFPLRDRFRQIKSLFHYNALGQRDNNGIYLADGFAAKQEFPLNQASVKHALAHYQQIFDAYLAESGSKVYFCVAPDKGYYLAADSGHLAMDYAALFRTLEAELPWAEFVDITDTLTGTDYYRTDTHWRQENLLNTAQKLCEALGATPFREEELIRERIQRPFYGVYHGQAALPMAAEDLYILRNAVLDSCTVYDHETGKTGTVYDMTKLESRDLYDVFLSGARALLTVTNPNAGTQRELIVFRDSFGSSLIPLLLKDYATVTLVDTRYISADLLDQFVDFRGQDVLLLYSTLVLNNSSSLK